MTSDLHKVQASILRELIFHNGSAFSKLNTMGLENDHFTFHVKQLVSVGYVEKKESLYFLTQKGKMFAGKLDVDALVMEKQGTPSVAVTARRVHKGKVEYLVQQRLKEPFLNYFGFINGKIRFGEFAQDAARRELLEETGLVGEPQSFGVGRRIGGSSPENPKIDNFFFIYLVDEPTGTLVDTVEGKNFWKTAGEIRKLKVFPSLEIYLDIVFSEKPAHFFEHFVELGEI